MMHQLPKKLFPFFCYFLKPYKYTIFFMLFLGAIGSLDRTLVPYILKLIIDKVTNFTGDTAQIFDEIHYLIFLLILLCVALESSHRIIGFIGAKIIPNIQVEIRKKMLEYVLSHSLKYFHTNSAGSVVNKIADMAHNIQQIIIIIAEAFSPILSGVLVSTILLWSVDAIFGILFLAWAALQIGLTIFACKATKSHASNYATARSTLHGIVLDVINNILSVKFFSRKAFELNYIKKCQRDLVAKTKLFILYMEKIRVVLAVFSVLELAFIIYFAVKGWQNESLTLGELVFVFSVSGNMLIMVWWITFEIGILLEYLGVCDQALDLIRQPHEFADKQGSKPLRVSGGEIAFKNVTFGYAGEKYVFVDKNITIHSREKVGLVGASGSGKSTFINLILHNYESLAGQVLIDEQDVRHVTQDSLYRNIIVIPQNDSLFNRTIRENILYGRDDIGEEELFRVAKEAHCHDFITELKDGYDTVIGERGTKLSGGQKQLIAIARAIMLPDVPIVIMDEATSALDLVTDEKIQLSLGRLIHNKTAIVIAHRLSTLLNMDRILVFDNGKIVEDGTHADLLAAEGYYARLWRMQISIS